MIAIVSALHAEWQALLPHLQQVHTSRHGGRDFHVGNLGGHRVVGVLCGVGKVAAASTTTLLLDRFGARAVLFTGTAGGLAPGVRVGDVVVATALLQHDLDASPLFPRWQVPQTGCSHFVTDAALSDAVAAAATQALQHVQGDTPALLRALGNQAPQVHRGLVISGDRFIDSAAESAALRADLPEALAVEMEGAAVAQVCAAFGVPLAVLRSISDRADEQSPLDFMRFVEDVASVLAREVVPHALAAWAGAGAAPNCLVSQPTDC